MSRRASSTTQIPQKKPAKSHTAASRLGKSAQRLLARLAERPLPDAGESAEILIASDLAMQRPDGMLAITAAGCACLARHAHARDGTIDPFVAQHIDVTEANIQTDQGRTSVAMDASESPLAWLARHKSRDGRALIGLAQLQAGERLRAEFTRAHMMPRITANWTSSVAQDGRSSIPGDPADVVIECRQRVRRALDAVGPEFSGLLLDVCCFLKRLEDVERERGWPQRCAKIVLQLGLDRLARHYGYDSEARGRSHAPVRTWLAPDAAFVLGE
jgi:hypothetical protein